MEEIFFPYSKTVLNLFDGNVCYQIPPYQRPYNWEDEQIEQLWEDISEAFQNDESEYFLGSIILIRNKDDKSLLDVVDGQQRITTLMILFCVLRDVYYNSVSDNKKKNRLLGRIKNLESDTERLKLRTHLNEQNKFENEILDSIDFDRKYDDDNAFMRAAFIFREKIIELKSMGEERLENFTDYLLERVRVITIECTDQKFAIKLFRTLNTRGLELDDSDLIKSYLMSKLTNGDDVKTFEQDWVYIETKAKDMNEELDNLFTYYAYYLLARNPKESIAEELEEKFKDKNPKKTIYELRRMIDCFYDIISEDSKLISALRCLRHDIYWKSILLSAKLESWTDEDLRQLTKLLRFFYYVYWIAGYTSSRIKQTSFNIISWIKQKKDLRYITNEVVKKIEDDKVVAKLHAELEGNVYRKKWVKPLLMLIEYEQTDETNIHLIANIDKMVQVEHILPQDYLEDAYWLNMFKKEEADGLLNTLGNLTLLSGKKNIRASNLSFPKKRRIYEGKGIDGICGFRITQKILDEINKGEDWNPKKVEDRKVWLKEELMTCLSNIT